MVNKENTMAPFPLTTLPRTSRAAPDPLPFTVEMDHRGQVARLSLVGELDGATTPILQSAIARAEVDPTTIIVLDLGELTFIDSSGLLLLLKASERAGQQGRGFGMVDPRPNVHRILRITGTTHLLQALPPLQLDEPTSPI